MNITKITHPEAQRFINAFLVNREINRQFYQLVKEKDFDFRMINTDQRKSDSPRESLVHQIVVTRSYINGAKTGILDFRIKYDDLKKPNQFSKSQLLIKLAETEQDLIRLLSDPQIGTKMMKVPWNEEPILVLASLWGLDSHEILHTGWNLALMDHLNIPRFPALKAMWG